jgi:ATP-dependent Clp protease adaptor protein ClpS
MTPPDAGDFTPGRAGLQWRQRPPTRDSIMAATEALPAEETDTRTERQPPYAVVLHNDDVNTMDFVIAVLRLVFGYTVEKCFELMIEAHEKGRSVVWVGPLEVAELKADQIKSCGPDPTRRDAGAHPLGVTVEPVA